MNRKNAITILFIVAAAASCVPLALVYGLTLAVVPLWAAIAVVWVRVLLWKIGGLITGYRASTAALVRGEVDGVKQYVASEVESTNAKVDAVRGFIVEKIDDIKAEVVAVRGCTVEKIDDIKAEFVAVRGFIVEKIDDIKAEVVEAVDSEKARSYVKELFVEFFQIENIPDADGVLRPVSATLFNSVYAAITDGPVVEGIMAKVDERLLSIERSVNGKTQRLMEKFDAALLEMGIDPGEGGEILQAEDALANTILRQDRVAGNGTLNQLLAAIEEDPANGKIKIKPKALIKAIGRMQQNGSPLVGGLQPGAPQQGGQMVRIV